MHQLMVTSQTMDCELHKQWVIVERAKQQLQNQQQQQTQTTTHLDDVKEEEEVTSPVEEEAQVVISSEQDEVEMKEVEEEDEEVSPKRLSEEEDDDVLLGSFFDRNETDSNCVQQEEQSQQQQPAVQPARQDEWLITPLPCLTSITCSQRSLVDNDPLENLLIEHPSMSVFVTVTSSAMAESAVTPIKPSQESAVFKVFSENVEKKVEEKKESSLGKSVSQRKRKGMETTTTTTTTTSPSPTSTMRRKANKRNKKSPVSLASPVAASPVAATVPVVTSGQQQQSPSSSNNKENMQVRTLLSSEFRSKANPASKLDSILLGKNQMKRNNKHANKFNSNNSIQRKFHKLQQPVCC